MSTVTYHKQPAIHKTRGSIPLAGTAYLYRVKGILWPEEVEKWISKRLISPTLHVCCGKSQLGDIRSDLYEEVVDVQANMNRLPFSDNSFATILIDPPYNSRFQIMHDMLNELHRVARERIIFQHHFSPVDKDGYFKKCHAFRLKEAAILPEMPNKMLSEFVLAVRDGDEYYLVKVEESGKKFILKDLTYWQPRTYFGRVQLISVMDRVKPATKKGYKQLPMNLGDL